tara:strand:- start:100 stop:480 length:381 start_codon:yes stop_codon:yes gene_type:complete
MKSRSLFSILAIISLVLCVSLGSYAPTENSPPGVENPTILAADVLNIELHAIAELSTANTLESATEHSFELPYDCMCIDGNILALGDAIYRPQGPIFNLTQIGTVNIPGYILNYISPSLELPSTYG